MKKQLALAVFGLVVLGFSLTAFAQATDPWMGTWKLNLQKSKVTAGPPMTTNQVSTWESVGGGQFKNVIDSVDAKGQKSRTEIVMKFDGAEYEYKGAAQPTTRSYKRIDARTFEYTIKVNGKVTTTNRVVVAADGKSRTIAEKGTNPQGQAIDRLQVWEKQ